MSPKPVDDLIEDEIEVPAPARRDTTPPPPPAGVQELSLPEEILSAEMPIIRARVVYLGPGEAHAISMSGQIHEQYFEDPEGAVLRTDRDGVERRYTVTKKATDTGITQYDFTIRDIRGRMIPMRMMPDTVESKLRGRPFTWCEHVGHLRNFFMMRDERGEKLYHIMAKAEHFSILNDHIRRSERGRRQIQALYEEVAGGRRG